MAKKGGAETPFGRVITAMVTPMDSDLRVDLDAAQRLAQYLLDHGSDSIVVSGTTGESPTLTSPEKLDLFRAVKEVVAGRGSVIAGTGGNSTAASVDLTAKAAAAGADAVMLVVPYYNKPPQEGLYRHFREVAAATELPVVLYNVPGRTSCNMEADTVIRLANDVSNIVALKEAAGNLGQASKIVAGTPEDFYMFSGEDELNLPYLAVGANGFISVTGHVVGQKLKKMCGAFHGDRTDEALQIHNELMPITKALFVTTNPIMVKAAMNLLGLGVGGLRPPLIEAGADQVAGLRKVMEDNGLL